MIAPNAVPAPPPAIRYATGEAARFGDRDVNDVWKSVVVEVCTEPFDDNAWEELIFEGRGEIDKPRHPASEQAGVLA